MQGWLPFYCVCCGKKVVEEAHMMKEPEKIVLASIGGITLYLFLRDKNFRKALLEVITEHVKKHKERSETQPLVHM